MCNFIIYFTVAFSQLIFKLHMLKLKAVTTSTTLLAESADDKLMIFLFYFTRKLALTFHANSLSETIGTNAKTYFLGKIRKKYYKMSSAEIITQHAKCKMFIVRLLHVEICKMCWPLNP